MMVLPGKHQFPAEKPTISREAPDGFLRGRWSFLSNIPAKLFFLFATVQADFQLK
jgi:hypothetical protein